MGTAIAHALVNNKLVRLEDLLIVETSDARRTTLRDELNCTIVDSCGEALHDKDIIVLAIKPQVASQVFSNLAPFVQKAQVVVSIMAGISTDQMKQALDHAAVVRVMPNTPSQISEGMSAIYSTPEVTPQQREQTEQIVKIIGSTLFVKTEDAIDAATAISGSGPAYIFYVAEHMIEAAKTLGFTQEEATQLVSQTIKGAALLWEHQALPVDELRRRVTSPGGTTEAALKTFENQGLGKIIQQGVQSAYSRAKELANQ